MDWTTCTMAIATKPMISEVTSNVKMLAINIAIPIARLEKVSAIPTLFSSLCFLLSPIVTQGCRDYQVSGFAGFLRALVMTLKAGLPEQIQVSVGSS